MLFGKFFPPRRKGAALKIPTRDLIARTGFNAEELRDGLILPAEDPESPAGYRLIVGDPEAVDREAFKLAGVNLMAGDAAEICAVWQAFQQQFALIHPAQAKDGGESGRPIGFAGRCDPNVFSLEIVKTLARLAADAAKNGAKEVFIGYPAAEDFEFLGSASRFRGQVDSNLGTEIARSLPDGEIYRTTLSAGADAGSLAVRRLIVGCVRELNRPVVYLSWDDGRPVESSAGDGVGAGQVLMAFPSAPPARDTGGSAGQTIVLVDDDIRYLTIVGSILRRRGWQVHEALRASTGLELIDRLGSKIDLVIADIRMPEMDGIQFLAQLRRKLPDLPVLMLTSDHVESAELAAVKTGCSGFVLKQKELNILLAWVCRLLNQPFLPSESVEIELPPIQ